MSETLAAIAVSLVKEKGESLNDSSFFEQLITWLSDGWIEASNYQLPQGKHWPFQYALRNLSLTLAGGATYAIDEDISEILTIRLGGSEDKPLDYTTRERLMKSGLDLEQTGKPEYFYLAGWDVDDEKNLIGFYKPPDASYTAEILAILRALRLGASEIIPAPVDFVSIVKDYGRFAMWQESDQAKSTMYYNKFQMALQVAAERLKNDKADIKTFKEEPILRVRLREPVLPGNYPEY